LGEIFTNKCQIFVYANGIQRINSYFHTERKKTSKNAINLFSQFYITFWNTMGINQAVQSFLNFLHILKKKIINLKSIFMSYFLNVPFNTDSVMFCHWSLVSCVWRHRTPVSGHHSHAGSRKLASSSFCSHAYLVSPYSSKNIPFLFKTKSGFLFNSDFLGIQLLFNV
jgi:hypothetical protein